MYRVATLLDGLDNNFHSNTIKFFSLEDSK